MVVIALVFEAARRVMGWGLPLICGLFLLYAPVRPAPARRLAHRGYGLDQIVGASWLWHRRHLRHAHLCVVHLHLPVHPVRRVSGTGRHDPLFNDFAMGTVGHTRGGPAKVSVISSGLMGTINGSGVANVVTTGQFTIPLMKRFGYSPAFAGGVEATSSMGGQIMPPVMGAVAFIMAETINVPYLTIVKAAMIPAILYFVTAFWMVHLEAGRKGLTACPKTNAPTPGRPCASAGTCCCRWPAWWPCCSRVTRRCSRARWAWPDGDPDLWRRGDQWRVKGNALRGCSGCCWAWPAPAFPVRHRHLFRHHRVLVALTYVAARGRRCPPAGGACRWSKAPPRPAGGHRLRPGGRDHRRHQPDRRGRRNGRLSLPSAATACSWRCC
jgi:hypothetical protein